MPHQPFNPVTRALTQQLDDPHWTQFASYWDQLEDLIIRVFREKVAPPHVVAKHRRVRAWLEGNYPEREAALRRFWSGVRIGGESAKQDPFAWLIDTTSAEGFVGNWTAMQTLPAAREALNRLLLYLIENKNRPS
jgi:hypothetical protein